MSIKKVAIVDYGMGNISSLVSAFKYLSIGDVVISSDKNILEKADKLILPGVGNFSAASDKINELFLRETLNDLVCIRKKPILGICLGMQLLGTSSTEGGYNRGLGFIDGIVDKFDTASNGLKVPHVGYNQVKKNDNSRLYFELSDNSDFYFTHSYKMNSVSDIGQSNCIYGDEFVASFEIDNIAGVQFHPELSQTNGLKLIKNFIELF